jgi:hypothetical protein
MPHFDRLSAATNKLSYIGENNAILSLSKDEQWQTSQQNNYPFLTINSQLSFAYRTFEALTDNIEPITII